MFEASPEAQTQHDAQRDFHALAMIERMQNGPWRDMTQALDETFHPTAADLKRWLRMWMARP